MKIVINTKGLKSLEEYLATLECVELVPCLYTEGSDSREELTVDFNFTLRNSEGISLKNWIEEDIAKNRKELKDHFISLGVNHSLAELLAKRAYVERVKDRPERKFVTNLWIDFGVSWYTGEVGEDRIKSYWGWVDLKRDLIDQGF